MKRHKLIIEFPTLGDLKAPPNFVCQVCDASLSHYLASASPRDAWYCARHNPHSKTNLRLAKEIVEREDTV